jgi:hypothetical protein
MSLLDPAKVVKAAEDANKSRNATPDIRADVDWDVIVRRPNLVPKEYKERGAVVESRVRDAATRHYREFRSAPEIPGIMLGIREMIAQEDGHADHTGPDLG